MKLVFKQLRTIFIKPELIFVILAVPFGIFSAILVPQLSVSDENMHFLKAYNLATGDLGNNNCHYPREVAYKASSIYSGNYSADFSSKANLNDIIPSECGSAASYSPIMHIPQAIGIFLAKLIYPSTGLMVLFGRLTNLAFFAIATYFIIKKTRLGKWAFVVIGLFPLSIHMAASISSDVMNTVIVFAFAAFVFNLFTQLNRISRKQIILLICLSSLLALTKVTNIVLLLPLLFLPTQLFDKNKIKKLPFNVRKWMTCLLCGVLAILVIVGWQKIYGATIINTATESLLSHNPLYFFKILYNTYINPVGGYNDVVLRGVIGEFASFRYHLPSFMLLFCFLIFGLTLLYKTKDEDLNIKNHSLSLAIGSLGAFTLLILTITYAMYTIWAILPFRLGPNATYADGVQGRYFTAALVFLIPPLIWLQKFVSIKIKSENIIGMIVFFSSIIWLLFYTLETWHYFLY